MYRVLIPVLFILVAGRDGRAAQLALAPSPSNAPSAASGAAPAPTRVELGVGRSTVVEVGAPIARVSLTSADIADALVTTPTQLLINGKVPGTISMFVWERGGALRQYEVVVQREIEKLAEQIRQLFPGENISVRGNGSSVVLSGSVSSKEAVERAVNVAAGFVEKRDNVVSLLQVQDAPAARQVLLRVRFAEVSRSALSQLGASFFTSPLGIENTLGRLTTQQYDAPGFQNLEWTKESSDFGADVTSAKGEFTFGDFLNLFLFSQKYDIGMMVKALQTRGLFQSLAEPNLVAESGKEASFLAGGEFPIPIVQGSAGTNAVSVQFKEFGVRLNFTPTVIGDRIRLKVRPEVSTLDFANGVVLSGFRIPALSTRRTETELELRHGQTFAIAGLLNNQINSTMQKIPGIGDIPILGYLFRSRAAQKDQTELVVMITPEILAENSPGVTTQLPRIQERFMDPIPENRSQPTPPPAFPRSGPGQAAAPGNLVPVPVAVPAPAAAPLAASPAPAPAESPAADVAPAVAAAPAPRPMTAEERKALERARKEEERLAKEAAKAAAKQAEIDARLAKEEEKRQKKLAEEQAKRDREAAKRAAEAARKAADEAEKQADADRKRQKAQAVSGAGMPDGQTSPVVAQ
jgi:pilus assembly protein CpaC